MFKFSIIIQSHKDRGFFGDVIKSIKEQSLKEVEIILSSDNNPSLVKFAKKHKIKFSLGQGHSGAINKAIDKSTGKWIKVIDEDDMLGPDALQAVWDNKKIGDIIQGNALIMKGGVESFYKGKDITIHSLLPIIHNPINWSTVYFDRKVFEAGRFDERIHFGNDYDFYLNALSHGFKIGYLDKILGYYRIHPDQLTTNYYKHRVKESIYLQNKYKGYIMSLSANDDLGCLR